MLTVPVCLSLSLSLWLALSRSLSLSSPLPLSMYSHHQFQYSPQANGMYSSILSQGVTMETGAGGGPGQMSGHVTCIASEQVTM